MPSGTFGIGAGLGGVAPPPPAATGWAIHKLGAGGQLTYIDVHADGTMLSMPDIHGLYVWDPAMPNIGNDVVARPLGMWRQVVTAASVPNAFTDLLSQPPGSDFSSGINVYSARMAPSNSSRMYMYMGNGYDGVGGYGYFYTSTNKGQTWTKGGVTTPNLAPPAKATLSFLQPTMAVDPHNEQLVFMGITGHGLWKTTNAGASWTQIPPSQVPISTGVVDSIVPGGHLVAFDDLGWSSGNTQTIYTTSYGIGVYRSIDGGANWTFLNSPRMPIFPGQLIVDQDRHGLGDRRPKRQ